MKSIEEQLEEALKKKGWFCPQISSTCNHECYCYIHPKIKTVDGVEQLQQAFCLHVLHQEQIEVAANVQL